MKLITILIGMGIIAIGIALRVFYLSSLPNGFFVDEASIGYNAYTLLTSGVDEHDTPYPFFLKAFGEYKGPVQTYSTIPFIKLFGLTEFAVRLASAIYGILTLGAIYLLVKELYGKEKSVKLYALMAMLLLAISPWHIHFSRVSLEGLMPYVLFTTLATYFYVRAHRNHWLFPLSIVFFVLALYSYFPARLFIPLFGIGLFIYDFRFFKAHLDKVYIAVLVLLVMMLPMARHMIKEDGMSRWKQVNIFTNPPEEESVYEHILSNYFRHYSADFLFIKGEIGMPGTSVTRHSVAGFGELYLFQMPFLLAGLYLLFRKFDRTSYILLLWLFLYPIGSMFTTEESPVATRSIIGVIPLQIISAVGIVGLFSQLLTVVRGSRHNLVYSGVSLIFCAIVTLSFFHYVHNYIYEYPRYSSDYWGWQYGARDIIHHMITQQDNYDELIVDSDFNAAETLLKFYAQDRCPKCMIGRPDDKYNEERTQLYGLSKQYIDEHKEYDYTIFSSIMYPDQKEAFVFTVIEKNDAELE